MTYEKPLTFNEWWERNISAPTPETYEGWKMSCLYTWNAAVIECVKAIEARGRSTKNGEWKGNNHAAGAFAECIRTLGAQGETK